MATAQKRRHENKIQYRPGLVSYYPDKVTSKDLILGYAKKNSVSLSKAVDMLINPTLKKMTEEEKNILRMFAKQQD